MMQISDKQQEEKIMPLFRLGFRPFFLGGAVFSIFSLVVWVLMFRGVINFSPLGGGYWWHIHEMIFGFAAAIIAGFLLTAVQNWTGIIGIKGNKLIAIFLLWLSARVLLLFPNMIFSDILGHYLSAIIDISFLPITALILAKPIMSIKQYRNLFFVPLLLLFTLANTEMHLSLLYPETFSLQYSAYSGILLTTVLMSVMAGRVIPMFTANGTKTTKVMPLPWLEKLTNGTLAIAMSMMLLHPLLNISTDIYQQVFASLLIVAGISQAIRWFRWKPWITLTTPLLWSLHISIKFIWVGLILLGLSYLTTAIPSNHIWHLLTVGGMAGLILAMISRVSLGHTGRPLAVPKLMNIAFIMITFAALIRALGPWLMPERYSMFIDISALCWIIAFALFTLHYGLMLTRARKDGHPG